MIRKIFQFIRSKLFSSLYLQNEKTQLMVGAMLSNQIKNKEINSINEVEFSVFSQFGDDGIIQWLVNNIDIPNKTFIEFGVEDYSESNTRFLMINDNWSGFVMDGSTANIERLQKSWYYWKYNLNSKAVFIDKENINSLISEQKFSKDVGLLHIDLDGNDYYIWEAITCVEPIIVIVEYNSIFGSERPVTVIYDSNFFRGDAHYSYLYWGSSIASLVQLAHEKGYAFIGCNKGGNNAYFIRNDKMNNKIKAISIEDGFIHASNRETRAKDGSFIYITKEESKHLISGLEVFNTKTKKVEHI